MPSRQNLITRILSGHMDRDDQVSEFNQYQNEERDSNYNRIPVKMPETLHIFFSHYKYEDYSGSGYLWGYNEETDTFFYNSGSHCSCYGLEGQWDMEDHTYEEMVAVIERQIAENNPDSYYYSQEEHDARVYLLKFILGEV